MAKANNFPESLAAVLEGRADDAIPDHVAIAEQSIAAIQAKVAADHKSAIDTAVAAAVEPLNAKIAGLETSGAEALTAEKSRVSDILKAAAIAKLDLTATATVIESGKAGKDATDAILAAAGQQSKSLQTATSYHAGPADAEAEKQAAEALKAAADKQNK